MAIGIDSSKWKPRKLNGTPAGRQSLIIGCGILSIGLLIGAFYQFSSLTRNYRTAITVLYQDPIEEIERKAMIASGMPYRSGDKIRKLLEDEERPDRPENELTTCKVVSKYFCKETVMEDSFSDFQEKKKYNSGPKNVLKARVTKKKIKKVRGQKDIRKLIKDKESELVSYSKDFNQICENSGLDVDAEQLQLAIALSKSLQEAPPSCDDNVSQETKPLSSQERTTKIRITLQEYGFQVAKSFPKPKKRVRGKKHKLLQYKLLLASDEQKKQIISDKYSEVLATNIHKSPKKGNLQCTNKNSELYSKATDICYEFMKNNEIFYVKNLCFEVINSISLLRDWSEILGRPSSPKPQVNNYDFDNKQYTQTELDVVLSGSISTAQDIVRKKHKYSQKVTNMDTENIIICIDDEVDDINKYSINPILQKGDIENNKLYTTQSMLLVTQNARSVSPDLFDDDISILDPINSSKGMVKNQDNQTIFMDLTKCIGSDITKSKSLYKTRLCSLEDTNTSKRNSKDFMEITDCIPSTSKQCYIGETDLTQGFIINNCEKSKDVIIEKDKVEKMDLTQSSNSDVNDKEIFSVQDNESLDETIIINDYNECNSKQNFSTQVKSHNLSNEMTKLQNESVEQTQQQNKDNEIAIENNENDENFSPVYSFTDHVFENSYFYYDSRENTSDNFSKINPNSALDKESPHETNQNNEDMHENTNILKNDNVSMSISNIDNNKEQGINIESSKEKDRDIANPSHTANVSVDLTSPHHICNEQGALEIDNNIDSLSPKYNYNDYAFEHSFIYDYEDSRDHEKTNDSDVHKCNDNDEDLILVERDVPNVDLTQSSDSNSSYNTNPVTKDDVLIAYDDIIDVENKNTSNSSSKRTGETGEHSLNYDKNNDFNLTSNASFGVKDKVSMVHDDIREVENTNILNSNSKSKREENSDYLKEVDFASSNNSEAFDISDNEFNYSMHQSRLYNVDLDGYDDIVRESSISNSYSKSKSEENSGNLKEIDVASSTNCEVFDISDNKFHYSIHQSKINDVDLDGYDDVMRESVRNETTHKSLNRSMSENDINTVSKQCAIGKRKSQKQSASSVATPIKALNEEIIKTVHQTPKNSDYIIKTNDVTPMADYASMSSPERNKELDKYGLKPFKRKRAIQLLTYLYNQTHPVVESCDIDCPSPSKKPRYEEMRFSQKSALKRLSPKSPQKRSKKNSKSPRKLAVTVDVNKENTLYIETKDVPDIREIKCDPEEWVFQTREKAKIHSCRVPLHIAFHNYVSCRRYLRESILRYEPVNIDVIHKELVSSGYRYNPKDLLKFMDKKCITVKTADNNARNRK